MEFSIGHVAGMRQSGTLCPRLFDKGKGMNHALFEQALRQGLPASALRALEKRRGSPGTRHSKTGAHSKTTIVTMTYRDGIMCVADRKTSGWGYTIMSQDSVKIYKVSPFSALLGCGSVADIQLAERTLKFTCQEFFEDTSFVLTTDAQANYLAQCCRIWNYWYGETFSLGVILAGVDEDGPEMYQIDQDGCSLQFRDYVTFGSGGMRAEDTLDLVYEDGMPPDKALNVAMQAMFHAGYRDSGSSDARVATPSVATVTLESGVTFLPDSVIEDALDRVVKTKRLARRRRNR